ncbi:MAG: phosphotriesterase [Eubacteriales bacterium]
MIQKVVRTVAGDIDPEALGYCQCHEHLFLARGISGEKVPSLILDDYSKTTQELKMYFTRGGRGVVDAQPVGCGRMASELRKASLESGVHVIASTGFHKLDFYDREHFIFNMDTEQLEQLFVEELTIGMFTDKVNGIEAPTVRGEAKAGIIKAASDGRDIRMNTGSLPVYKKLFTAAGKAAKRTGSPVITHLEMGKGADSQLEVLTAQGILPQRIVMSHLDRVIQSSNSDYQLNVARSGVYMQLDTIGRFKYHSDEEEAEFILMLCEKGYEDKILLGLDTTSERMKSYGGAIGLDYILDIFRLLLHKYGIGDDLFHRFTVENPKNAIYFERKTE